MRSLPCPFDQVAGDPLSYLHPERMFLPPEGLSMSARQRSVINGMLLDDLRLSPLDRRSDAMHPWIRHWALLPGVATLIGSWLLRPQLAWQGRLLQLPRHVRRFIASCSAAESRLPGIYLGNPSVVSPDALARQVQAPGIRHLLAWQPHTQDALVQRLKLMFAPAMDEQFQLPEHGLGRAQQLLLLQAIHHAKNHTNKL